MDRVGTAFRRRELRKILAEVKDASSQSQLTRLLVERGFPVTQATVSRDLRAMGAVKAPDEHGMMRYMLGPPSPPFTREALAAVLSVYALSVRSSANLVVIKTPPGAAHVVAAAIDGADLPGVLGTVAGDDTMLAAADEETGGRAAAALIEQIQRGDSG